MCGETIHAGVVQFDARPESARRGDPRNNKDPSGGFSRASRASRCAPHLLHCTYCTALAAPANRVALHSLRCTMCECETQVRTIVHRNKCNATSATHLPHRIYRTATSANAKRVALHNVRMRTSSRANVKQSEHRPAPCNAELRTMQREIAAKRRARSGIRFE